MKNKHNGMATFKSWRHVCLIEDFSYYQQSSEFSRIKPFLLANTMKSTLRPTQSLVQYAQSNYPQRKTWPERERDQSLNSSIRLQICVQLNNGSLFIFRRFSQICKKRLLASSCLSVRSSACNNSALTSRIFMKFYIAIFFENMSRKIKFH